VGHVDHDETTTTQSVITGNVTVESGGSTGRFSTDLIAGNGHLDNTFNATKVSTTLQTEIGAETAAETAVELGVQAYGRWGPKTQQTGNAGENQPRSSSQVEKPQSDQSIQTGVQDGGSSSEGVNTQLSTVSAHDGTGNQARSTEEAAVRQTGSVTMVGQEPAGTATGQPSSGSVFWQESAHSTVMTPEGRVEYISVTGHHRPSQPVPGAASTSAVITWAAAGKLVLTAGTMFPELPDTVFSTGLAAVQLWEGDKTGALVTLGLGALNLVGVDAAAGRVILGMKETQTTATVGRGVAEEGGAAATTTASDIWQSYEKGSAGAAQPSLPEGYSWVKNAEGDLGIKTPEGKVVADSQGKGEIVAGGDQPPSSPIVLGGGLQTHESAGGHLIEKHVGKTDDELVNRLSQEPKITGSSSFPDRATAERVVSETIDANQVQISQFLSGKGKTLVLKCDAGHYVGNIISKEQTTPIGTSKVTIVIKRDASTPAGYRIQTEYPSKWHVNLKCLIISFKDIFIKIGMKMEILMKIL
jgi:hypothetical protein